MGRRGLARGVIASTSRWSFLTVLFNRWNNVLFTRARCRRRNPALYFTYQIGLLLRLAAFWIGSRFDHLY